MHTRSLPSTFCGVRVAKVGFGTQHVACAHKCTGALARCARRHHFAPAHSILASSCRLRRPDFGPRCAVSVPYSSREVMRRLNASCWRAAVLFQALFTCVCQRCSFGSCVVLRLSRSIAASTTASSPHTARMLQQPHQPRSTLLPGTCTFKKASAMCLLACTVCSLSRLQTRRWCAERSLCANASVRCVWPDHIT